MIDSDLALTILELLNETLTATIVIVAVSILLYNLTRRTKDRVTRASAVVLVCVIVAYLTEVFLALDPNEDYYAVWLRFQWIGIAFVPAALFHLSDALLATTGRPSRGRRTKVVRINYMISALFALLALFTNAVISGPEKGILPQMRPGAAFPVYLAYLITNGSIATINVIRARRRCLTLYTRRRMTYLLAVFLTPAYGIFPYSLLLPLGREPTVTLYLILNLANLIIMLMVIFMAYPLSFFGTEQPDRVIKARLLEMMLRGPLTGGVVLTVIIFVPRVTNFLGLDGDALMPFVAVTLLLVLQWSITTLLPVLERWLVYTTDQQRAQWIQKLSERLLTEADAAQLLESILAAICDQMRVPTAFVARMGTDGASLVQVVGSLVPSLEALTAPELSALGGTGEETDNKIRQVGDIFIWHSYWLVPLRSTRGNGESSGRMIGVLGVWARAPEPNLDEEENERFHTLTAQAGQVLEDVQQQAQVFLVLDGLASQMDRMQQLRGISRYGHVAALPEPTADVTTNPNFTDFVKDALRDYWGGPKLTDSELLKLNIVWREMEEASDQNPVRALRTVLAQAIENLKPQGQRSLTTSEWILYNILEMRFLQGRKVRDVALRLAMSESDLYRKQRVAIEEVARQIEEMEHKSQP